MDWDKVEQLLTVIEKLVAHGTQFKALRDDAVAELTEIAKELEEAKAPPPKEEPVEEPSEDLTKKDEEEEEDAAQEGAPRV